MESDQQIELKLTLNDLDVIMTSLGKLPYDSVFSLIEKLKFQIIPQIQPQPSTTT